MSVGAVDTSSKAPQRLWLAVGLALGIAALAFGFLFWREIAGAWRVWLASPTYNHCFLVLPVALYLIWDRRQCLTAPARPDYFALLALPVLSLVWLGAAVLGVLEAQQLVVLTMVQAILYAVLGRMLYWQMLGPLLYLYLLVPSGEFMVPTLQDMTARFAVELLQLAHVPVYSDGILISIPEGDFIIAEACAGLRFLIASAAFGMFFALTVYRLWWKRAAFIAAALIVPIFANGIRAFGIIYLAHLTDDATAVEADHIIYGWGFFTAVLLLLIVIGMRWADRGGIAPAPAPQRTAPVSARAPFMAVIAALVLAALGPAYLEFLDNSRGLDLSRAEAPAVSAPWTPRTSAKDNWDPVIVAPDRAFRDSFTDGTRTVERYAALYAVQGRHNTLVRSQNRIADEDVWVRSTLGTAQVEIDGRPATVAVAEIHNGAAARLVWSFYVVDGEITGSPAQAKLRQARAILAGHAAVSAFVAVATDKPAGGSGEAAHTLAEFLHAMSPMGAYLDRVRAASLLGAGRS